MTDEELVQIEDWLANGSNCPLSQSERATLGQIVAELRAWRALDGTAPNCPWCGTFGPLPCRQCGEPVIPAPEVAAR